MFLDWDAFDRIELTLDSSVPFVSVVDFDEILKAEPEIVIL